MRSDVAALVLHLVYGPEVSLRHIISSKSQSTLDPTQPVEVQIADKLHSVRPEWNRRECRDRLIQLVAEVMNPS